MILKPKTAYIRLSSFWVYNLFTLLENKLSYVFNEFFYFFLSNFFFIYLGHIFFMKIIRFFF